VLTAFKSALITAATTALRLLGLRGLVFKSHGSADAIGVRRTRLNRAYDAARNNLVGPRSGPYCPRCAAVDIATGNRLIGTESYQTPMTRYSRITGTGSYLPPRRLTNADLVAELAAQGVETSDEWIVERTGIRARHFAADGVFSSDLALEACQERAASCWPARHSDIDLIIVATSTPDMVFPSTACILQNKLGAAWRVPPLMCRRCAVALSML